MRRWNRQRRAALVERVPGVERLAVRLTDEVYRRADDAWTTAYAQGAPEQVGWVDFACLKLVNGAGPNRGDL